MIQIRAGLLVLGLVMGVSAAAAADAGRSARERPAAEPERLELAQAPIRQFNAKGTHQCQSRTSIGHKCEVRGVFTSCSDAAGSLRLEDCCPRTKDGGVSIGFAFDACSQYTFPK